MKSLERLTRVIVKLVVSPYTPIVIQFKPFSLIETLNVSSPSNFESVAEEAEPMAQASAEEKALQRLKSFIEDETSTVEELDELLTAIGNKNCAEWTNDSPLMAAVKSKRKDIIEALVKGGIGINSTVKNHSVSG